MERKKRIADPSSEHVNVGPRDGSTRGHRRKEAERALRQLRKLRKLSQLEFG